MDIDVETIKKAVFSRKPPSIKNKEECYILFEAGFFGNKVETADSYEEVLKKAWKGSVSMRSRGKRIDRSLVSYNIPIEKIPCEIKKWQEKGIDIEKVSFSLTPPDDRLIFQGEIMLSNNGLHIVYSTVKKPMNISLREEEKIATGLEALNLLKENLTPASFDDIMELLRLFPNDVIEFSVYEIGLGTLANRNTIIWEVRGY